MQSLLADTRGGHYPFTQIPDENIHFSEFVVFIIVIVIIISASFAGLF